MGIFDKLTGKEAKAKAEEAAAEAKAKLEEEAAAALAVQLTELSGGKIQPVMRKTQQAGGQS